jgi:8-oxo-dGTP pyrophosphatase MutT (NUDIX family)
MSGEPSWAKGRPKPPAWTSGEGRTRFENPWLTLVEYDATAPTGHETLYGVIRFKKLALGVLPIHADGTVTLVGQHRFPLANYVWEMPEGGLDGDEPPIEGIRRELAEEAGLKAGQWLEVLRLELSNSVTDEIAVCWIATDLSACEDCAPDETEALERARVPFRDLLAAIEAGQVRDALTVATTLRAYHMAREGLLPDDLARAMLD